MKYKSEICEVMHQDAMAEFEAGLISEARMKEYDEMCLIKEPEAVYKTEESIKMEPVTA